MGKRSGKKPLSFLSRRTRSAKRLELQPMPPSPTPPMSAANVLQNNAGSLIAEAAPAAPHGAKGAKKKTGARLWMRFDRDGQSEILECDKNAIIKRAAIPARDLRILGPVFSHSSNILGKPLAHGFFVVL